MAELFDAMVRHQIYIEGLKRGKAGALAQSLLKLNTDIKAELNVPFANLGDMNKTQVLALLGRLKKLSDSVFNAWLNDLIDWLQRYVVIDRELLARVWSATSPQVELPDFDEAKDGAALWGIAKGAAIGANGLLLLPFLRGFTTQASARIVATVNMAVVNRATPADALAAILGAPAGDRTPGQGRDGKAPPIPSPAGGLASLLNRQGNAVTDTIIQHVAAQTNFGTARSAFAEYLWISVLDDATTDICRSRNGNVYRYGEGPLPPAHIRCRSSTIPFDGTGPVTIPSFTMWASGQPKTFVNDAFDAEPGSTYEGSRALSLEQFAGKFGLITA